jgi:hypothetical protein
LQDLAPDGLRVGLNIWNVWNFWNRLVFLRFERLERLEQISSEECMSTLTCLKSMSRIVMILLILVGAGHAAAPSPGSPPTAKATFAGGCFWCMEPPYDELDGVMSTISGYIGGTKKNPTYEEVVSGNTGHAEAADHLRSEENQL